MPQTVEDGALASAARKWRVKSPVFLALMALVFFAGSGCFRWPEAWLFILLTAATQATLYRILMKVSPGLLIERASMQQATKPWDKAIAPLVAVVLPLAAWIVAALDHRFGWSHPALLARALGFVTAVAGVALMMWAMAANRFFSATVRIQPERGHTVVSHGPYAYVRHPGYIGLIAYTLATAPALGSDYALVPAVLCVAVLILRTALEDRTLHAELPGYREYALRVRARLVPLVW